MLRINIILAAFPASPENVHKQDLTNILKITVEYKLIHPILQRKVNSITKLDIEQS